MVLAEVIGQKHVVEQLNNIIKHQRVGHAYVFSGPVGVGKAKMALEFARAINCLSFNDVVCEECNNCIQIKNFNHPDVIWIKPDGKSIKIDQIRKVQRDVGFVAIGVKYKLFIIEQAELLTTQAANSLLKIMEEPENKIVTILLVENYHQLLPTIKSRSQIINFSPLDPFNMVEVNKNHEKVNDLLIAAHLTNDINNIDKLIFTDEFANMKKIVVEWTEEIIFRKYHALSTISNKIVSIDFIKENIQQFLDLLILWLKDLINIKLGREKYIVYKDFKENLVKQASNLTELQIINQIEEILDIKKKIGSNVNLQLTLEHMVFSLWEGN